VSHADRPNHLAGIAPHPAEHIDRNDPGFVRSCRRERIPRRAGQEATEPCAKHRIDDQLRAFEHGRIQRAHMALSALDITARIDFQLVAPDEHREPDRSNGLSQPLRGHAFIATTIAQTTQHQQAARPIEASALGRG
jgi:hypothetical protein